MLSMRVLSTTLLLALLLPHAAFAQEATPPPIPVGEYECRTGKEYKLRECRVERRGEQTVLVLPAEVQHLVSFEAELRPTSDKKMVYVSVLNLLDQRPWGCYMCQERCAVTPDACSCKEVPAAASEQCKAQPVHFVVSQAGKDTWRGTMPYRVYGNRYEAGQIVGVDYDIYALEVTIKRKKK